MKAEAFACCGGLPRRARAARRGRLRLLKVTDLRGLLGRVGYCQRI